VRSDISKQRDSHDNNHPAIRYHNQDKKRHKLQLQKLKKIYLYSFFSYRDGDNPHAKGRLHLNQEISISILDQMTNYSVTIKCTVISMRFAGTLERIGQYKQINKRVLLCVPLSSLRSLSDLVQPLHFLQQQSTHNSGRQAAKTVSMSLLFSILISIFRFFPCCLCEWVQYYISCVGQPLKISTLQRTACLYKEICKLSMLPMAESLLSTFEKYKRFTVNRYEVYDTAGYPNPILTLSCIE
jgi:hypothetical protein